MTLFNIALQFIPKHRCFISRLVVYTGINKNRMLSHGDQKLVSGPFLEPVLFDLNIVPSMRTFYRNLVGLHQLENSSGQIIINNIKLVCRMLTPKTLYVIFLCENRGTNMLLVDLILLVTNCKERLIVSFWQIYFIVFNLKVILAQYIEIHGFDLINFVMSLISFFASPEKCWKSTYEVLVPGRQYMHRYIYIK